MKVRELQLIHFRSARDLTVRFDPHLTLLVGANGAGKSTILDAVALMLSWAAARLKSANSRGRRIAETDIHNEKDFASLRVVFSSKSPVPEERIDWSLLQVREGRVMETGFEPEVMTSLSSLSSWAAAARERVTLEKGLGSIPLFVHYPVNRAVLDIPLRIRKRHSFDILDSHDGALTSSGVNFRAFFEWYRGREDIENERLRESGTLTEDPQLRAVRRAILAFMPEFSEVSVKRTPLRMEVRKKGMSLRVDQLSDGEKCLFAMAGDLARRLAIANPSEENALLGSGVVLIDEVDLHLHPAWQRTVTDRMLDTFPNCQFILTTHSPQVITHVRPDRIRLLSQDQFGLHADLPTESYGRTADRVLEDLMGLETTRPDDVADGLRQVFALIGQDRIAEAKRRMDSLRTEIGEDPELVRAEVLIKRREILAK